MARLPNLPWLHFLLQVPVTASVNVYMRVCMYVYVGGHPFPYQGPIFRCRYCRLWRVRPPNLLARNMSRMRVI